MKYKKILLIIGLLAFSHPAFSSDLAKEKRWADQIVDAIIVGEPVWLTADGTKFLSIYAENEAEQSRGAAIILHGLGVHPNWPDVVLPLRSELPQHGWATLSLQMPILANDAEFSEYEPLFKEVPGRINAGIAYLKQQGYQNIVIIGHSLGAKMAVSYTAQPGIPVQALVTIGLSASDDSSTGALTMIEKTKLPMLDLYGSQDLDAVVGSAKARAAAARKGNNTQYRQTSVAGANHFFVGVEADLVRTVKSWLSKFSGKQAKLDATIKP